jgi:hypothetical protein
MAQTLHLVNRVHNVMGNFNAAMSNWVQRSNPDQFKQVTYGPKNSRGYFIKLKNQDDIAENLPLPFLNSNSKIEDLDQKFGLEMWRNPRSVPDYITSRSMIPLFSNDWVELGFIPQRVIGTTEFIAQFESYMGALDFQLELIAMNHVGKSVEPGDFRYYVEIPEKLVYYTEKGEQQLDLLTDDIVTYSNVYSINQKKFRACTATNPLFTPAFPQPPTAKLDTDSMDTYTVNFEIKWEIDLPMWLVLNTHHKVDSFTIRLAIDFESGGGIPSIDYTQHYIGHDLKYHYSFEDMSQFTIDQTAFHNVSISVDLLPDWNETDNVRVFINDTELSNFILADNEITFSKYMETNDIIWVARYVRDPEQDINLLADYDGNLFYGTDLNDAIGDDVIF